MSFPIVVSSQHRRLGAEQRRALEMLAAAGLRGCAGPTLLGQGFRVEMLVNLVGEGLAAARREPMKVGTRTITIVHIHITDSGWRALMIERRPSSRPVNGLRP
jgi:hypothetical protein